ncbi:tetratricopeptide repeat protein [Tenacibaculum halocynthiae]|uniref:tetratricopeptide repeat protein n=1 Tax=Tenacibaculum halocynthiae TaxID=1254437 RepID=UPI003D647E3A
MTSEESQLIFDFLNNQLSENQYLEVQQRMINDKVFREKVILEKQLFETLNKDEWSFVENIVSEKINVYEKLYNSKETSDFKKNIQKINSEYQSTQKRSVKKLIKKWYPVAAAIFIICSVVLMYPRQDSLKDVYASSLDFSELPSLVVRSESGLKSKLTKAQDAFELGEYKNALKLISSQERMYKKQSGVVLLYKGIAQMELKKYDDALKTFDLLSSGDFIDAPRGIWYKALLFLKKEDKETAQKLLKEIASNPSHYKYLKAKVILEGL